MNIDYACKNKMVKHILIIHFVDGYLTDPTISNPFNWRDTQHSVPNYSPMVPGQHLVNTNCSPSTYLNGAVTDTCAPTEMPYQNPADYPYDDVAYLPAA